MQYLYPNCMDSGFFIISVPETLPDSPSFHEMLCVKTETQDYSRYKCQAWKY